MLHTQSETASQLQEAIEEAGAPENVFGADIAAFLGNCELTTLFECYAEGDSNGDDVEFKIKIPTAGSGSEQDFYVLLMSNMGDGVDSQFLEVISVSVVSGNIELSIAVPYDVFAMWTVGQCFIAIYTEDVPATNTFAIEVISPQTVELTVTEQ